MESEGKVLKKREELTDEERQAEAARKQERARQRRDERIAKIKEVQKDPPEEYLRAIALEVRVGTETKNYAAVAKKEQLSGLDLQVSITFSFSYFLFAFLFSFFLYLIKLTITCCRCASCETP